MLHTLAALMGKITILNQLVVRGGEPQHKEKLHEFAYLYYSRGRAVRSFDH